MMSKGDWSCATVSTISWLCRIWMSCSSNPAMYSACAACLAFSRSTNTLRTYLRGNGDVGSVRFEDTGTCSTNNCSRVNGSHVSRVATLFMIYNLLWCISVFTDSCMRRTSSLLIVIRLACVDWNSIGERCEHSNVHVVVDNTLFS